MCVAALQLPLFQIDRTAERLIEVDGVYITEADAALTQQEREAKGIFLPSDRPLRQHP